jgi:hypothetical protein
MKRIFSVLFGFLFVCFSNSFGQKEYWSGEVRTIDSYSYGRIEVRMKSAEASGVTSTCFTYNINSSVYNELDIEIMGMDNDEAQYTSWTPDQSHNNHREVLSFNPHAAFHVHAIEWTPDYVAWYADGYEVHRDNSERIQALFLPVSIMMNFWIPNSVDWAGTFYENNLPLYAMYDWIKYYEYTPGVNNNFTLKWTDDFTTFNDKRWKKSTSTFGSNLCDFKPQNVLIKDGYLLLCMTKNGTAGSYTQEFDDTDIDAPYPAGGWIFGDQMMVEFSEEVDETSAETVSNYITLGLKLSNPELQPSKRKVLFKVDGAESDKSYPAYFKGIKDLAATPNVSELKKINLQCAHALPLIVDIGNEEESGNGYLSEQKWDETFEYGTIGGSVKNESGITSSGEYSSLCNNAVEGITFFRQRLGNGNYNIKLFFAETEKTTAGSRVFDIYTNGEEKISNLDIFGEAGSNTVVEKTISGVNVNDNMLELYFNPDKGLPILHGIIIENDSTTAVKSEGTIPDKIGLQSYPNPFNPSTNIKFTLPKQSFVKISVFDTLGRLCRELASGKYDAGEHIVEFNASSFSSGIYFISLNTPEHMLTQKIVYLK